MSKWDIKPLGVRGQLTMTGEAAKDLADAAKAMVDDLSSAAASAGTAVPGGQYNGPMIGPVAPGQPRNPVGPVAAALSSYMEERQKKLQSMAERTGNSMTGAAEATNAYVQGDLDMAADAQAKALQAPKIDLPGAGK
ncbi:DUF6507 family protein [Streptomyces indicus]|uniref:Uncharacterized protein n=1 Tax=Streptomyces indicus TaxID=417292 RepID=A0A1G9G1Q5_9ACTN|nr:DUF6507 family protein [Streptomyces indicus]SDK94594.1 hypothetical protein SAMN05421806_114193 [Streptomyces indicus]